MSSIYQPKRKELAKVKCVTSDDYSNNKRRFRLVGCVARGYTAFVTTQRNRDTGKCSFIDDTSSLTKRTKNELTNFFMLKKNSGRKVAYLVVPKENNKVKSPAPRDKGKGKKKK